MMNLKDFIIYNNFVDEMFFENKCFVFLEFICNYGICIFIYL